MTSQGRFRRQAALTTAVLAAACALAPSAGAKFRPSDGNLSPRLAELAKPSVRSASPGRQAAILDVAPDGPGSLLRDGSRVLVDVRFDHGAVAMVDDLRAAGAEIVHVSSRYQAVTVAVPPNLLGEVAGVYGVNAVTENLAPILAGMGEPGPSASVIRLCFGAATSEGDTQLNAMIARDAFSVDGTGVTVGILSDSFDKEATAPTRADDDVASGDLPGPGPPGSGNPCGYTTSVDETGDTYAEDDASDEGRAMAQIVHDLAPGASLAFATAFNGINEFADNIRALRDAGAEVIVDDVLYLNEPFFQDGPVSVAVNDVTADDVTYFSSAGNNNLIDDRGRDIASWEAPAFRDSGSCPAALAPEFPWADHCMDFDPTMGRVDNVFDITVQSGVTLTLDLQWAQPWNGVTTDLDAYLLLGSTVVADEETPNLHPVSQQPVEIPSWENTTGTSQTVGLAINRCDLVCDGDLGGDTRTPLLKFALLQNGSGVAATEYPQSADGDVVGPTIFGHNGAHNAMSIGAIRFGRSTPERFSSRGPVTHYFGPVTGTTPAAPIPRLTISKPDIVATDGGANTFFGSCVSNVWRFFGTSASAPHAAAIAALELDAAPGTPPADVKRAQIDTAAEVAGFPATAVGAGIVDAYSAIDSLVGGSPTGLQTQQSTAQNCPPVFPPPPSDPVPAPVIGSTVFSAPSVKKRDKTRPQTQITKKPAKESFTAEESKRLVFRFASSENGSSFLCKIDRGRFHQCYRKLTRWFRVGEHVFWVKARDVAGNVDLTPAVYRFEIKQIPG